MNVDVLGAGEGVFLAGNLAVFALYLGSDDLFDGSDILVICVKLDNLCVGAAFFTVVEKVNVTV